MNNLQKFKSEEYAKKLFNMGADKNGQEIFNEPKKILSEIEYKYFLNETCKKYFEMVYDYVEKISIKKSKSKEDELKKVFENINETMIGEMFETAKCINEELTAGVYFLRNSETGLLKIGCSTDIFKRIKQIKQGFNFIGYPCKLKLEAIHLCFKRHINIAESIFHKEFKEYRKIGEWFDISKEKIEENFISVSGLNHTLDDVFISFDNFESDSFKDIKKDFQISPYVYIKQEINNFDETSKMFLLPKLTKENFLKIFDKENPLAFIIDTAIKNNVRIFSHDYTKPIIATKIIGYKDSLVSYNFNKLKEEKYNPDVIEKIITKINNFLQK